VTAFAVAAELARAGRAREPWVPSAVHDRLAELDAAAALLRGHDERRPPGSAADLLPALLAAAEPPEVARLLAEARAARRTFDDWQEDRHLIFELVRGQVDLLGRVDPAQDPDLQSLARQHAESTLLAGVYQPRLEALLKKARPEVAALPSAPTGRLSDAIADAPGAGANRAWRALAPIAQAWSELTRQAAHCRTATTGAPPPPWFAPWSEAENPHALADLDDLDDDGAWPGWADWSRRHMDPRLRLVALLRADTRPWLPTSAQLDDAARTHLLALRQVALEGEQSAVTAQLAREADDGVAAAKLEVGTAARLRAAGPGVTAAVTGTTYYPPRSRTWSW